MRKLILVFLLPFLAYACQSDPEAKKIVDQSIAAHGGDLFKTATIAFDFRDKHYEIFKSPERYRYVREFTDSIGKVRDVLDNDGFTRTVNGEKVEVTTKMANAYSNSVNSVAYFAFLPYGLNDEAVNKKYLGDTELEGASYHLVKATFSNYGGGEDHNDEFLYWINKENFRVDFFAYSYETDGGGVRFRKAVQTHEVSGLLLQDYENYKVEDKNTPLESVEELYKSGELELLSEIRLENIEVISSR
ncbi:MAG: DUF6503 family protein [Cyclobacteriaceae bacterium]